MGFKHNREDYKHLEEAEERAGSKEFWEAFHARNEELAKILEAEEEEKLKAFYAEVAPIVDKHNMPHLVIGIRKWAREYCKGLPVMNWPKGE